MAPEFIKPKTMPNSDPNPNPGIWPLMACPSENLGPLLNGINTICLGVMAILRHQSKACRGRGRDIAKGRGRGRGRRDGDPPTPEQGM